MESDDELNDEPYCPECRVAVGVGMYLDVCKELEDRDDLDCNELYEKVTTGKITVYDLFKKIKHRVGEDEDKMEILDHIDSLIGEDIEKFKGKTIADIIADGV